MHSCDCYCASAEEHRDTVVAVLGEYLTADSSRNYEQEARDRAVDRFIEFISPDGGE